MATSTVTYKGSNPELLDTQWSVPQTVLAAGQGVAWIESQHRQALAEQAAAAEAAQRQQELLAARLEQQRLAAEADAATPAPGRDELKQELQQELGALSTSVIAAAAAITGRGEAEAAARADWEGRHEQLVSTSEATITEAQAQVQAAMATSQSAAEQVQAELQEHRLEVRNLETELRTTVSALVGPTGDKGEQGFAGSGVTIAMENPLETDATSWAQRWYGRDQLVSGDSALVPTKDALRTFRYTGRSWVEGPRIEPKVVAADIKASVLQENRPAIVGVSAGASGGGGGGGGEHLLVNRIGVRTSIAVADSSNWAGVSDVTSGQIVAELTALDGSLRGKTYLVLIPFTWSPDGDQFTVDGELGGLTGLYDINVSVQRSPAVAPPVFTGAMPPGSNRTLVFLSVVPSLGGGGDTTSFRLGGDIEWAHIAQGAAVSLQSGGLQPLWIWS